MRKSDAAERNTRCHRCGGLLGMGKTMMYRVEPVHGDSTAAGPDATLGALRRGEMGGDPAQVLEELRRQLGQGRSGGGRLPRPLPSLLRRLLRRGPFPGVHLGWSAVGDPSDFCQACGQRSTGVGAAGPNSGGDGSPKRLLSRLSGSIVRRRPPFEDAEGRIDIRRLLAGAAFPVYGLVGNPLGLRLHGVVWGGSRNGRAVHRVALHYATDAASEPERAIVLSQGPGVMRESIEGRLSSELNAIMSVVPSHSTEALREEYRRSGNIHRDWNLARIRDTERRRLAVGIDGASIDVELAYWWKPEQVALAHVASKGRSITAASVGMSHVELLGALKTMAPLQAHPDTLAAHQREYGQGR